VVSVLKLSAATFHLQAVTCHNTNAMQKACYACIPHFGFVRFMIWHNTIRYIYWCPKAAARQLNLPHRTKNRKQGKELKRKTDIAEKTGSRWKSWKSVLRGKRVICSVSPL